MNEINYGLVFKDFSDNIFLVELDDKYTITDVSEISDHEGVYEDTNHDQLCIVCVEKEDDQLGITDFTSITLYNDSENETHASSFIRELLDIHTVEEQQKIITGLIASCNRKDSTN